MSLKYASCPQRHLKRHDIFDKSVKICDWSLNPRQCLLRLFPNYFDEKSIEKWYFYPGEGNGNPLQYSCLENPMDRGDWRATVHGVTLQFSRSVMSDSLRPHESQHARPPCPSQTPRVYPNSCPSSWWCHPTITSSVLPFSSCPNPSQHQGLFQWVNSSHEVAKVLELQLQHQSFQWVLRTDFL